MSSEALGAVAEEGLELPPFEGDPSAVGRVSPVGLPPAPAPAGSARPPESPLDAGSAGAGVVVPGAGAPGFGVPELGDVPEDFAGSAESGAFGALGFADAL
jgi:hypothetical protein